MKQRGSEKEEREVVRSITSYSSVAPAHSANPPVVVCMFGIVQNG